ncbi:replication-associated recombination protein A [Anaerosalibacter bizertensis]|uniref:replication-associated recombination protein A n=1 Tax=Anaerosalibacter bizertensis TaxID=932217 RepID=UPI001D00CA59|nr:replication-associated recombination protein A [Anaerosalibacter bizertensis]MCB5559618.1 replication-associated recombination protein A [Anaerosalibacter bizertensis]MCG4583908.1 replication-associated recombination protein A [Anaerosalibacter bizertensis]
MDLFSYNMERQLEKEAPLAERMRPKNLKEFVGQNHLLGEGKFLNRAIKGDRLPSMIFYGPPGTGKTTLAMIIANTTEMNFEKLSAVTSGVKDIRKVTESAEEKLKMYGRRTILFIDEIHRFNKSQQDALLPFVERGILILVGATTENPYFEVNKALLSRMTVIQLEPLKDEDLKLLLSRALKDSRSGLGKKDVKIDEKAINYLVNIADGDARTALNSLELAVLTTPKDNEGKILINKEVIKDCIQTRGIKYDKSGDEHYDTTSAFIKSMRGSDPDATLYWLAKMIEAGEDPKFIGRRIIISASEDVGNADPQALNIAVSAFQAIDIIGMPEGRIPLAQAAVYIACAPKSNASYLGINNALEDVRDKKVGLVPLHLRDTSYNKAKELKHGIDYKYPHNYPNAYIKQQYLPNELKDKVYYNPTENGYEKNIKERLNSLFDKNK